MPTYDFDRLIDRHGYNTVKYRFVPDELKHYPDLLALWVADMDFATPPFVIDALRRRLDHPVLGYHVMPEDYWQTVCQWIEDHHQWRPREEWMTFVPGIVKGIAMAIQALVPKDGEIIIQPPVYHPFHLVPQGYGRRLVLNPLLPTPDGGYRMDLDGLERVITPKCRLLILCNPHNPAGVLWDRPTLCRLAHICAERGITVISDEIHSDMPLWGKQHLTFPSVSDEARRVSVTFGAPSKTFNMAGLVSSWAVVPDDELRFRFFTWMEAGELSDSMVMSTIATQAALREGEDWREQMLAYVMTNIEAAETFLSRRAPRIRVHRPDASFLLWLDFSALGLEQEKLMRRMGHEAHIYVNDGTMFGPGGEGHVRLNVGVPRSVLMEALERIARVFA